MMPFFRSAIGLVTENLFGGEAFYGCNLLQTLHIQILFVAKDDVAVGFSGNVLAGEADQVLQGERRNTLIDVLRNIVVSSAFM